MRLFVTQLARCVAVLAGVHDDDRQLFIDKGIRPVLHLAGGIAFGVDVADFFELESTFESDGKIDTASEI